AAGFGAAANQRARQSLVVLTDDAQAAIGVRAMRENRVSAVGGAVVDDNQLEVHIALVENAREGFAQRRGAIVDAHDDRYLRRAHRTRMPRRGSPPSADESVAPRVFISREDDRIGSSVSRRAASRAFEWPRHTA